MADKPILFSAPMVRALLAGTKTQTRRILKPQPFEYQVNVMDVGAPQRECDEDGEEIADKWGQVETVWSGPRVPGMCEPDHEEWHAIKTPRIGDRLWVREAWRTESRYDGLKPREIPPNALRSFEADYDYEPNDGCRGKYRHSRFMPRWASRITLTATDVRVERLQHISREDALAEGVEWESADPPFYYVPNIMPHSLTAVGIEEPGGRHAERSYAKLWNHINGAGAWDMNPWIVALTFAVQRRNIDTTGKAAP